MFKGLESATSGVHTEDLPFMVLTREELPEELRAFQAARDGEMDNETMAAQGFPGSTTQSIRATGRVTGYLREFVTPVRSGFEQPGVDLMAATVVHLFQDGAQVSRWMREKFVGEFRRFVGRELGHKQKLLGADELTFDGFSGEAVGLRTLQATEAGLISSTVVDFRVGRLLGVAYLVATGDVKRAEPVGKMGVELERRIVRVVLGSI